MSLKLSKLARKFCFVQVFCVHSASWQKICGSLQCDFDRLVLSTNPFMEKNLEFLIECMDDLSMEQQKVCPLLKCNPWCAIWCDLMFSLVVNGWYITVVQYVQFLLNVCIVFHTGAEIKLHFLTPIDLMCHCRPFLRQTLKLCRS